MMTGGPAIFVPMIGLMTWAAIEDLRCRRIPNVVSLSLLATGLVQSWTAVASVSGSQSALGALAGFGMGFVLFAMGALGGGDVKLLAGVGAWLGPGGAASVFVLAALAGMAAVLVQAACTGRTRALFRNSALIVLNVAYLGPASLKHEASAGRQGSAVEKPLPYALPVLLATLVVILGLGQRWL